MPIRSPALRRTSCTKRGRGVFRLVHLRPAGARRPGKPHAARAIDDDHDVERRWWSGWVGQCRQNICGPAVGDATGVWSPVTGRESRSDYAPGGVEESRAGASPAVVGAALSTGDRVTKRLSRRLQPGHRCSGGAGQPTRSTNAARHHDRRRSLGQHGASRDVGHRQDQDGQGERPRPSSVQLVRLNAGDRIGMGPLARVRRIHPNAARECEPRSNSSSLRAYGRHHRRARSGRLHEHRRRSQRGYSGARIDRESARDSAAHRRDADTPPMVEAVESTLGDTQLGIVGFGNEADWTALCRPARPRPSARALAAACTRRQRTGAA